MINSNFITKKKINLCLTHFIKAVKIKETKQANKRSHAERDKRSAYKRKVIWGNVKHES